MGTSTDAMLYFGIECGDEDPFGGKDIDGYDAQEQWNNEHGPARPANDDYRGPEWAAWRKAKEHWEETGDGIEVGYHCSGEYPMYYIALKAKHLRAWRGSPKEVPVDYLAVSAEQIGILHAFFEKHDVPWEEPKWRLASYWDR